MLSASTCFSEDQKRRIATTVAKAESATSAEIVPVVATASGRYDRAEDIAGLWLGAIAVSITWALLPKTAADPGAWDARSPWMSLLALVAATLAGFIVGAVVTARIGWLRRLFTPAIQMREEVASRSRQAFFDARVFRTAGHTGLLVYVSLYERLAAVLADQSVQDKVGQAAMDQLCNELTNHLRQGDITSALCATIEKAGPMLAAVLPIAAGDKNEIPNALVTLEG
jgi:putative membrane protein